MRLFKNYRKAKRLILKGGTDLSVTSLADYPAEIQSILMFLKENKLPVVIVLNVNTQTIGNIINSTVNGCNVNMQGEHIIGHSTFGDNSGITGNIYIE